MTTPQTIHLADYQPFTHTITHVDLTFRLAPHATRVLTKLSLHPNPARPGPQNLRLDGEGLKLIAMTLNGQPVHAAQDDTSLTILAAALPLTPFSLEYEVEIDPAANTALEGLYMSNGLYCTQCEAEGFRHITFYPDRPDVMAPFHVRIESDLPILLSNGNPGTNGPGFAEWTDPWPKPAYLFALVAGTLVSHSASFTTASGKAVDLNIWVRPGDEDRCAYAMDSLIRSMQWDERTYGREYDLDVFNIVAVDDFNFGAMENKGLNIFNSRYILADPDTATDADYDGIATVVAHEYFHNWSGNRVTCRDWFQLSLKEGFTVYRDQCFSADLGSAAVKRIEDVRGLRAAQFPEDAGPLAHPVRPDSYQEISNFYTATIYNKGAELIRMMATMLGPQRFRIATDLYFDRHDGTAATCEDFVRCMEFGGGVDLTQFRRWYTQAGTPRVAASIEHHGGRATLRLAQRVPPTPGQADKQPMVLPLRLMLYGAETGRPLGPERLHLLDTASETIVFDGIGERPVLSINRGFSAPVIVESDRSAADLAFLSAHDDDPFARYEATQQLMLDTLIALAVESAADIAPVVEAVAATLADPALDPAFVAEAVLLPSESFIGDQLAIVDPDAIHAARENLRRHLGATLDGQWREKYDGAREHFAYTPAAKGLRRLRNVALGYLGASGADDAAKLAFTQFEVADNMTDRQGALTTLSNGSSNERVAALDIFYNRYADNALVLDKWFQTQALATRDDTAAVVAELLQHPDFSLANPNRARSLIGAFAHNQRAFNAVDGAGYRLLAEQLLALDRLNPQTAAKLLPPLGRWRRYDAGRAALMRTELERLVATAGVSADLFEQASKSLAG